MNTAVKKFTLSAPILRIILIVTMVLIVIAGVALWNFGIKYLDGVAKNVASVNQRSTASNSAVSRLQSLEKQLDATTEAQKKVQNVVAVSKGYHFQNQITEDLQHFASSAGVSIESFTFSGGIKGGSKAKTDGSSSSSTTENAQKAPTIAGLTPVTVTISLKTPINYKSYLKFLHDIEQNSLKMQIAGLSLAGSSDGLTSQDLTIQSYISK